MLGRSRRQRNHSHVDELEADREDSLPEFSAQNLDDVDEGVGKVRVITGAGLGLDTTDPYEEDITPVKVSTENLSIYDHQSTEPSENNTTSDFIVFK